MGSEMAPSARSVRRDLQVPSSPTELSDTAQELVRAVEPHRRKFEFSSRTADLPDEQGAVDREFLAFEELEDAEESLELAELEQELFGAERTAVMVSKLHAAMSQR